MLRRKERLEADVRILSQALSVKRQAKLRLTALRDPQKQEDRVQELAVAQDAYQNAEQHDRRITDADNALQLIGAEKDQLIRQIKEITDAQSRRQKLGEEITKKQEQASGLRTEQENADTACAYAGSD